MTCWTSCVFCWFGRLLLLFVYHYALNKLRCPALIHQVSNAILVVSFIIPGDATSDGVLKEILTSFIYISFTNFSFHIAGFKLLEKMERKKDAKLEYVQKQCSTFRQVLTVGPQLLALLLGIGPDVCLDILKLICT